MSDAFLRIAFRVRREDVERVRAGLLVDLPWALQEVEHGDEVELEFLVALAEEPDLDDLREQAGEGVLEVTRTEVPAAEARPTIQAGRIRVRPPWAEPSDDPGVIDIAIASDYAFGTGMHPTTQLCLELLQTLEPGGALCDWGGGTGVLSIAAARLGWDPVTAVEVDPSSLQTIRDNAIANGVTVTTKWLNLGATEPPWAPTVTANLQGLVVGQAAAELIERPPERMIISGVMIHEADQAVAAYARHGMRELVRRVRLGWAAIVLVL
jgi:ribosomal protein L11 methyltransferase